MAKKTAAPTADAADAAPPVAEAAAPPPPAPVPVPGAAASPPATASGKKRRAGNSPRRGKKLRNHLKNQLQRIGKEPAPLKKAVQLLKSMKRAKFDETVEVHMSLGIDTTQSDQLVRGAVSLPHGIGKSVRVLVFCQGDNVAKAKEAGADFSGGDELIAKIQAENFLDFDVALTTQDMMGKVSRLGKVLGPRGLMPTPKAGTVIPAGGDISAAVQ
jgi:large subunit ribosomal protein L1